MTRPIGVLALQGGYAAHVEALHHLGHRTIEVRTERDLAQARGLVLPGGESTTMLTLLDGALRAAIVARIREGMPVLATCAGAILLAREVRGPAQPSLGLLDVVIERNAYGSARDSFEARLKSAAGPIDALFIRAPRITSVGAGVEVLATHDGDPVWVRAGVVHAATFHPELTGASAPFVAAFAQS